MEFETEQNNLIDVDELLESYKDLIDIIENYTKEFINLQNKPSPLLSKNDILVINDLFQEIILLAKNLQKAELIEESKNILTLALICAEEFEEVLLSIPVLKEKLKKNTKIDKSSYIQEIKLILLEIKCDIVLKIENNYEESQEVLKKIIEIQKNLDIPPINFSQTLYYMSIVKFNLDDLERAEFYAKGAIELMQISDSDKLIRRMSNTFELLATIYNIQNKKSKVIESYEKAYYLNLGKNGKDNINTLYYQKKCEILKESSKNTQKIQKNKSKETENSEFDKTKEKDTKNKKKQEQEEDKYFIYQMTFCKEVIHKGKTQTFSFRIPTTELFEPFVISLFNLKEKNNKNDKDKGQEDENLFEPKLFVYNIYFDKSRLSQYIIKKKCNDNIIFYTDETLNKILQKISVNKNNIFLSDNNLVKCIVKLENREEITKKKKN